MKQTKEIGSQQVSGGCCGGQVSASCPCGVGCSCGPDCACTGACDCAARESESREREAA